MLQTIAVQARLNKARRVLDELKILFALPLPGIEADGKAGEVRAALSSIATEIGEKMDAVDQDGELSDVGKLKKLEALAEAMRTRAENLRKAIAPRLESAIDSLRKALTAPLTPLPKDDAAGAIRHMEIRTRLLQMTPSEREIALWGAVEHCDDELLRAIVTAPKAFALVPADVLAKATETFWVKARPELAAQIETLETLQLALGSNFRSVFSVLDNLAGVVKDGATVTGESDE